MKQEKQKTDIEKLGTAFGIIFILIMLAVALQVIFDISTEKEGFIIYKEECVKKEFSAQIQNGTYNIPMSKYICYLSQGSSIETNSYENLLLLIKRNDCLATEIIQKISNIPIYITYNYTKEVCEQVEVDEIEISKEVVNCQKDLQYLFDKCGDNVKCIHNFKWDYYCNTVCSGDKDGLNKCKYYKVINITKQDLTRKWLDENCEYNLKEFLEECSPCNNPLYCNAQNICPIPKHYVCDEYLVEVKK